MDGSWGEQLIQEKLVSRLLPFLPAALGRGPIPPWPELVMLGSLPGSAVPHGGACVGKRMTWTTRADAQRQTCPQRPPATNKATRVGWTWKMLGQSSYSERTGTSTACHLNDKGLSQDILGSSLRSHTLYYSWGYPWWLVVQTQSQLERAGTSEHCLASPVLCLPIWKVGGKACYLWKECLGFLFFPVALSFSSWLWFSLTHPTSLDSLSSRVLVITWPWSGQLESVNGTGDLDPVEPEARFALHFSTVLCPSEFPFGSHHLQL